MGGLLPPDTSSQTVYFSREEPRSCALPLVVRQTCNSEEEYFIDRDPDVFGELLAFMRTGRLRRSARDSVDREELLLEADFYGLLPSIQAELAPGSLDGNAMERVRNIVPGGRDVCSASAAGPDGSLHIAHGSKITAYDANLQRSNTLVTDHPSIDLLHRVSDKHLAAGGNKCAGLHIYNTSDGYKAKKIVWQFQPTSNRVATHVQALASSTDLLFSSFESNSQSQSALLVLDKSTLQVHYELERQGGSELLLASQAAVRLQWLPIHGLLLTAAVRRQVRNSASFHDGFLRLHDLRSREKIWEWQEPGIIGIQDSFTDVVANEDLNLLFKISKSSGMLEIIDLRKMLAIAAGNPPSPGQAPGQSRWRVLHYPNAAAHPVTVQSPKPSPQGVRLLASNRQVLVGRGVDIEVWAPPALELMEESGYNLKKNFAAAEDLDALPISNMELGGQRLFVTRGLSAEKIIEVWETT
eukprot:SM000002S05753  [mRNA]  locus=s2:1994742:1998115:+ [translate_table: standard]